MFVNHIQEIQVFNQDDRNRWLIFVDSAIVSSLPWSSKQATRANVTKYFLHITVKVVS